MHSPINSGNAIENLLCIRDNHSVTSWVGKEKEEPCPIAAGEATGPPHWATASMEQQLLGLMDPFACPCVTPNVSSQ